MATSESHEPWGPGPERVLSAATSAVLDRQSRSRAAKVFGRCHPPDSGPPHGTIIFTIMKLSKEEVQHIATLSRLELTDEEVEKYRDQLGSILGYVAKLQELDTTGVAELAHGSGLTNVFRPDEAIVCDPDVHEHVLRAFPQKQGTLLEVQAVFEERTE